jgi:hypothetical protein
MLYFVFCCILLGTRCYQVRQRKSREHPRHPQAFWSYHVSGSEKYLVTSLLLLCFRSAHVSHVAHVAQNEAGVWLKNKTEAWVGFRWIFGQGCFLSDMLLLWSSTLAAPHSSQNLHINIFQNAWGPCFMLFFHTLVLFFCSCVNPSVSNPAPSPRAMLPKQQSPQFEQNPKTQKRSPKQLSIT